MIIMSGTMVECRVCDGSGKVHVSLPATNETPSTIDFTNVIGTGKWEICKSCKGYGKIRSY